mgnify:CR=1 FL=1|tara:strand:- start:27 stop:437 length:411 start_codon:yes stop_codon:yes gene_type:complete
MENSKYDNYWYFRTVADEDDDDTGTASLMLPIMNIVSMIPTSTTALTIYFKQPTTGAPRPESNITGQYGQVILTVTQGKIKDTIADLVSALNAGPRHSDGVRVIADDSTVEVGGAAGSKTARYFSNITACGTINAR